MDYNNLDRYFNNTWYKMADDMNDYMVDVYADLATVLGKDISELYQHELFIKDSYPKHNNLYYILYIVYGMRIPKWFADKYVHHTADWCVYIDDNMGP